MAKNRPLFGDMEEGRVTPPLLKLLRDAVSALRSIAGEKKKQTKLLAKISEDLTNISTDIEEIKQDM